RLEGMRLYRGLDLVHFEIAKVGDNCCGNRQSKKYSLCHNPSKFRASNSKKEKEILSTHGQACEVDMLLCGSHVLSVDRLQLIAAEPGHAFCAGVLRPCILQITSIRFLKSFKDALKSCVS